jgi:nitrogen regulatory protein PII
VKLITAVVPSSRLGPIMTALRLFGVRGLTLSWVYVVDAGDDRVEIYRGVSHRAMPDAQVRLDILAPDDDTHDLVHVIIRAAVTTSTRTSTWTSTRTSPAGVWVTPVDEVVRICNGEQGLAAI